MPVFFFFNHDMANLFAPGIHGQQRNRDLGFLFPALLFMGTLSGLPQIILPLGLYMLLGAPAIGLGNFGAVNNRNEANFYAKVAAFFFIALLVFWDFLPSLGFDDDYYEEEEELSSIPRSSGQRARPYPHRYDEQVPVSDDAVMVSAFSEISLLLLISGTLAIISHWDEVHSYIVRSLPRPVARRFRQLTRALNIHPNNASQGLRPASAEAINALEEIRISSSNEGDCSICIESFKAGDCASKLPCKHMFHKDCLSPWLSQRSSCPVCRASVERDDEQEATSTARQRPSATATATSSRNQGTSSGINAVWNALRSVLDPGTALNQRLHVEDREALMQLSIRELRERARARSIPLHNVVEKRDIVDLLLGETRART